MARLWLVSGWRGVGKTTFCRHAAERMRAQGWRVHGILSLGVFEEGSKIGFSTLDLRTGESRPLAWLKRHSPDDLFFGEWYFNRETIAWGNDALRASLPCELLVMDELGPLEFMLHAGWQAAFEILGAAAYRAGLVVVRPELEAAARQALPITHSLFLQEGDDLQKRAQEWAEKIS